MCHHGGVLPPRSSHAGELCVPLPQPAWDLLRRRFGGGPACTRLKECPHCRAELDALNRQKTFELEEFKALHAEFQEEAASSCPQAVYCLSSSWFKLWEGFVINRLRDPPGPIDNRGIIVTMKGGADEQQQQLTLRPNSDYVQISHDIWLLLHSIYGGGPEVVVRANGAIQVGGGAGPGAGATVTGVGGKAAGGSGGSSTSSKHHLPALAARMRARTISESNPAGAPPVDEGSLAPPRPGEQIYYFF